jgi:hypothetical protein
MLDGLATGRTIRFQVVQGRKPQAMSAPCVLLSPVEWTPLKEIHHGPTYNPE